MRICALLLVICGNAFAGNFYVSPWGGINLVDDIQHDKYMNIVGVGIGDTILTHIIDEGRVVGINGGYQFDLGIRLELEVSDRINNRDRNVEDLPKYNWNNEYNPNANYKTWSIMVNLVYEHDFGYALRPYIGGGVGYSWSKSGDRVNEEKMQKTNCPAYQLLGGVRYVYNDRFSFYGEYKHFVNGEYTFADYFKNLSSEKDITEKSFVVGIRYNI